MSRRYGPPRRRREIATLLGCGLFITAAGCRPARAAAQRLLVFGDSLAAGYGLAAADAFQAQLAAALRARGHAVEVGDGGVSGDTSAGARSRLDWVLTDRVDAAILEIGGNDALRGVDPRDMEANVGTILDGFAARHIPVLLSGMFAPPNMGAAYGREFRAVFDRLSRRPGLLYDPFFLDGVAGDPALNQADRIHPNPDGVRRIVGRLLPMVEKLLAEAGGA